jgi:hypothetical protein
MPIRATVRSVVMPLGGAPVGERFIDGNFVSSSKAGQAGFGAQAA